MDTSTRMQYNAIQAPECHTEGLATFVVGGLQAVCQEIKHEKAMQGLCHVTWHALVWL
jgi:hypothetical protein